MSRANNDRHAHAIAAAARRHYEKSEPVCVSFQDKNHEYKMTLLAKNAQPIMLHSAVTIEDKVYYAISYCHAQSQTLYPAMQIISNNQLPIAFSENIDDVIQPIIANAFLSNVDKCVKQAQEIAAQQNATAPAAKPVISAKQTQAHQAAVASLTAQAEREEQKRTAALLAKQKQSRENKKVDALIETMKPMLEKIKKSLRALQESASNITKNKNNIQTSWSARTKEQRLKSVEKNYTDTTTSLTTCLEQLNALNVENATISRDHQNKITQKILALKTMLNDANTAFTEVTTLLSGAAHAASSATASPIVNREQQAQAVIPHYDDFLEEVTVTASAAVTTAARAKKVERARRPSDAYDSEGSEDRSSTTLGLTNLSTSASPAREVQPTPSPIVPLQITQQPQPNTAHTVQSDEIDIPTTLPPMLPGRWADEEDFTIPTAQVQQSTITTTTTVATTTADNSARFFQASQASSGSDRDYGGIYNAGQCLHPAYAQAQRVVIGGKIRHIVPLLPTKGEHRADQSPSPRQSS